MILLAFLVGLAFARDSTWSYIAASLLVCLVLYSAVKNWMNFQDQITLHDLRRSTRDQTPDIST
jgi:hypothetical protein